MKILMTSDTVGGVWTYALDLAKALEPLGHEIVLATMGQKLSPRQWADAKMRPNVLVRESEYKLEWMDDPWADMTAAGKWLLELEEIYRPDVIHLNGYAHGVLPFRAPIVMVAHSCVLSWWRAVKQEAAPPTWDRYRREVARGLLGADVVVAPTAAMLATLEDNYVKLPRTRVIANGRDASLYRAGQKEDFILTAGRLWDEAKNVSALQAIASKVAWPVCVAGQDRSPDGHGGQINGNVLPLGLLPPDRLADWYSRASIYALPARYEPFGLSALEAALSGCALVLGDIPSLREVWQDAAMFVPPQDTTALQEALDSLIHDRRRRANFARRAKHRAATFTLARFGEAYAHLYRAVLRQMAGLLVDRRDQGSIPLPASQGRM